MILIVLLIGTALGFFMGCLIQFFDLPPFIITLAGLYLARGLCYVVSIDTIAISDPVLPGRGARADQDHRRQPSFHRAR